MLTLRQIEKWWTAKAYTRLLDELCAGRAEGVNGIRDLLDGSPDKASVAAAAMTIIRAEELRQSAHPHVGKMVRLLLDRQDRLGGWGEKGPGGTLATDSVITALAARGLAQSGTGPAVDNALTRLADLQNQDGEWSAAATPGDETGGLTDMAVTAFVLYQLATIRRPAAALLIDTALGRLLAPAAGQVDTQLNTLRRRIEARRVLAPAA